MLLENNLSSVRLGPVLANLTAGVLSSPQGTVSLTNQESRILVALCRGTGTVSREALYGEAFQRSWEPDDRALDVHVENLRRKFKTVCRPISVIGSVRGEGYEVKVPIRLERDN